MSTTRRATTPVLGPVVGPVIGLVVGLAITASGCSTPAASTPGTSAPGSSIPGSSTPASQAPSTLSPTPSPIGDPAGGPGTPGASALDLTEPGVAQDVLDRLAAAAGDHPIIVVSITQTTASIAVVADGTAQTWAYRDGEIQRVQSDINYVSQATFVVSDFNLSDVGALFRAAAAVAGSASNQELQIVDYSGSTAALTVSTNPESRTVFFHPDGTLLPTLDFSSRGGLRAGYADVVGERTIAHSLTFGSQDGVSLDAPDAEGTTMIRRQRSARTPVIVTTRSEAPTMPLFDPRTVHPDVVWDVLERLHAAGTFTLDESWTCVVDARTNRTPTLSFLVGSQRFTTDLEGNRLPG